MPSSDHPALSEPPAPSAARIYDHFLGGKDSYQRDRDAADGLISVVGEAIVRDVTLAEDAFARAVIPPMLRRDSVQTVPQLVHVAYGLPHSRRVPTHVTARNYDPDTPVLYVDDDETVSAHLRALTNNLPTVTVVSHHLRDYDFLIRDPSASLNLDQPVALLLSRFACIPSEDQPGAVLHALAELLAPGSYLAIAHLCAQGQPAARITAWEDAFAGTPHGLTFRTPHQIAALLPDKWNLVAHPAGPLPARWLFHAPPLLDSPWVRFAVAVKP